MNDPCNFANFANDANENVPRTIETEQNSDFHGARNRERNGALRSFPNASNIATESSNRPPQSS